MEYINRDPKILALDPQGAADLKRLAELRSKVSASEAPTSDDLKFLLDIIQRRDRVIHFLNQEVDQLERGQKKE
jgi:hypothetical protein